MTGRAAAPGGQKGGPGKDAVRLQRAGNGRRVSGAEPLRRRRSEGAGAAGPPRAEGREHPWAPPHLESRPRSAPRSDMPPGSKPQLSRLSNSARFSQMKTCPRKQAARHCWLRLSPHSRLPRSGLPEPSFRPRLLAVKREATSPLPQAVKTFPPASGFPQPSSSSAPHTSRGTSSWAPRGSSEHPLCTCLTWGSALDGDTRLETEAVTSRSHQSAPHRRDTRSVTGPCFCPWWRPAGAPTARRVHPGPRPPPGPGSWTPATCSRTSHKNIAQMLQLLVRVRGHSRLRPEGLKDLIPS